MIAGKDKKGQVAIFLVLILAGLTLLFALNVDIFTSTRSKTRLQNAADASALALARWQGATLNMVGDLNIAHLAAICQSNVNAISGIVQLQNSISFIGPTIGFKAANDIAKANEVCVSYDMTEATKLVAEFMDEGYKRMLDVVIKGGIRAGVDNAAILRAGCVDPRTDPDFYKAIQNREFWTLCCRYCGGGHKLPEIPSGAPDPEEIMLSGVNACFGSIGIAWENGSAYEDYIGTLADLARDYGVDNSIVNKQALTTNAVLFSEYQWCVYDQSEWRDLPGEFSFNKFPWLTELREEYNVCGGSATIKIEGLVELTSIAAQTNFITAQAAAKVLGHVNGRKVTSITPSIVLPSFSRVRLVPFAPGAAGRYGMADLDHIKSMLGLLGKPGGINSYLHLLEVYCSEAFCNAANTWYSEHGHNDADGCRPSGHGTERGGGTPYGI